MSSNVKFSRRALFRTASAASVVALVGCTGEATYTQTSLTEADAWAKRADQIEAYHSKIGTLYSKEAPPDDDTYSVPKHAPEVTIDLAMGYAVAYVDHVMNKDHFITTVYFRDQNGVVFYLKELLPGDTDEGKDVGVTFFAPIPEGTTQVAAFAFCNKHDHWWSEFVTVA